MLDNNEWKNEVQVQDIEQDQVYQAMISQWSEQDQQLDKIFAQGDQKIEKAIVEMYENEYAGTQTGRTAGRLAGKGAKKLGQYKSEVLHNMMMAKQESDLNRESIHQDASSKSRGLYEKIRFSPIHGHTPVAPELEAKPGIGGLILGLAVSGLGAAAKGGMFKAPDVGKGLSTATSTLESGAAGGQFMPSNPSFGFSNLEIGQPNFIPGSAIDTTVRHAVGGPLDQPLGGQVSFREFTGSTASNPFGDVNTNFLSGF